MREAEAASTEELREAGVNAGVYAFEVPPLLDALGKLTANNAQREFYLTDVIGLLSAAGQAVEAVTAEEASEALGGETPAEGGDAPPRFRDRRLGGLHGAGGAPPGPPPPPRCGRRR